MIIGLCGLAGAGKSTAANTLVKDYGFVQLSFAGALKDAVADVFGWPRHLLEGDTDESRQFREVPDPYWSKVYGSPLTPRFTLQHVGTGLFRSWIPEIWVAAVGKKMQDTSRNYVVSDARFINEFRMVKDMNGFVVRVDRGFEPYWFEPLDFISVKRDVKTKDYFTIDQVKTNFHCALFEMGKNPEDFPHPSEWEHIVYCSRNPMDYVLHNTDTIQQLNNMITHMMQVFTGPKDDKPKKNEKLLAA